MTVIEEIDKVTAAMMRSFIREGGASIVAESMDKSIDRWT